MTISSDSEPLLLTPGKRKRKILNDSDSSVVPPSSRKKFHVISSDSETSMVECPMQIDSEQQMRRERRQEERRMQRELQKQQEKALIESLRKRRPYVLEDEIVSPEEEESTSFIVPDFSDLDDSLSQGIEDSPLLNSLAGYPSLIKRLKLLQDIPEKQSLDFGNTRFHELAAGTMIELDELLEELKSDKDILLIENDSNASPLVILLLNQWFDCPNRLPKVNLRDPLFFLTLLVKISTDLDRRVIGEWLSFLKLCGASKEDIDESFLFSVSLADSPIIVECFIKAGANPLAIDIDRMSAVHLACSAGHSGNLKTLLERKVFIDLLEKPAGDSGAKPMHFACSFDSTGHFECLRMCYFYMPKPYPVDDMGWPPLLYALYSGSKRSVAFLLETDLTNHPVPVQFVLALKVAFDKRAALQVRELLKIFSTEPLYFAGINKIIERNITLLNGPLSFLLKKRYASPLNLYNKRKYLRMMIDSRLQESETVTKIVIDREAVMSSLMKELKSSVDLYGSLDIRFKIGGFLEEGILHGPKQEFISLLTDRFRDLFVLTPNQKYLFPFKKKRAENESVGMLIALLVIIGSPMTNCRLYPGIWKYICEPSSYKPELEDLQDFDAELYKNLNWLKFNDISEIEDTIAVTTEKDKYKYIQDTVNKNLFNKCFEDIKEGFYKGIRGINISFLCPNDLSQIFAGDECEINILDWKANTTYSGGLHPDHQIVLWFWDFVKFLDKGEKALLLQFATGRVGPPIGGFQTLKEQGAKVGFTISGNAEASYDSLPTSSTCFNLIKLPFYKSSADLSQKLLISIRLGSVGFSFT